MARQKTCGIYKITSPSGSIYIGQSIFIQKRWGDYKKPERAKGQRRLYNSFIKYGIPAHKFEVIYEFPNDVLPDTISDYEQFFIDQYREAGYDLLNIREAGRRGRISEETKKKMSIAQMGRKVPLERRIRMSETRKGRPSPRKGVKLSPEHKEKCRFAMLGKNHSKEAKFKISKNHSRHNLGKPATPEMILKNRIAHLGKKASQETKRKMSDAHTGRPKSKEHNQKVSIALKRFHERKRISFLISTFGMILNYKPCLSFRSEHFFPAPLLFDGHNSSHRVAL